MRKSLVLLSLLTVCCLMLAATPAMASLSGSTVYDNGPYNGTIDAWTINFGFAVSDSFVTNPNTQISGFALVYWDADSSDVITTVDAAIGSSPFGGSFNTYGVFENDLLGTNQFGYELYSARFQTGLINFNGAGWLTLQNACTTSGCSVSNPIYWDENSGVGCGGTQPGGGNCPSSAMENTVGSIPSEAFTLYGGTNTTTTPEPSSIMLFGSGILGLAGLLRRRLTR